MNLDKLQQVLGIKFLNEQVFRQALIHRSYLNENRQTETQSNERLEFLGDAVLELWCSNTLFLLFPNLPEGDLTNLRAMVVRTENLAKVAKEIKIDQFLLLSKGEEVHGGRENISILADTLESIIGAVYLDLGSEAAFQFLDQHLLPSLKKLSQQKVYKDPKSVFQEIAQAQKNITPHYLTLSETGPDHKKVFTIGAYIGDSLIATGQGNSKQKAEESAAIAAFQKLKVKK